MVLPAACLMVAMLLVMLLQDDITAVRLHVMSNNAAVRFYERAGFEVRQLQAATAAAAAVTAAAPAAGASAANRSRQHLETSRFERAVAFGELMLRAFAGAQVSATKPDYPAVSLR
jgi:hypothetical protein